MYTEQFTEVHDVLAALAPTAANAAVGNHVTGYVSLATYHRAAVVLHAGEAAAGATLDMALQQAQDTAGTGAKALTNIAGVAKLITQLAAADAGSYVCIEVRTPELDVTNGFYTMQATVAVGTNTYYYSLFIFGIVSRYEAVGVTDWQEIVP